MVAGKQILLSIAVLSCAGFETVLGGRLRQQNGGHGPSHALRAASGGGDAVDVPELQVARAVPPPILPAVPVTATLADSISLDVPMNPTGPFGTQIPDTQNVEVNTPTASGASEPQLLDIQVEVNTPNPTMASPSQAVSSQILAGNEQGVLGVVDSATSEVGSVPTTSLGAVGMKATPAGYTSSTEKDYVYPGVYGASGELTTDYRAPTRSVAPSRVSVQPNSGSAPGPPPVAPPADRPPSSTRAGGVPVPPAPVYEDDPGYTFGPGQPETTTTPPPVPVVTRPRGPPPIITTVPVTQVIEESMNLGHGTSTTAESSTASSMPDPPNGGWNMTTLSTYTRYPNQTWTANQSGPSGLPTKSISYCQPSDSTTATVYTSWSVVYTSTVTWFGNPGDYTPPYAPISTPMVTPLPECVVPMNPGRFTLSVCSSTGTGTKYVTCTETTSTDWGFGPQLSTHTMSPTATIVMLTTDKNPAVIFPTVKPPDYGVTTEPRGGAGEHQSASPDQTSNSPPLYNSHKGSQAVNNPAKETTPGQAVNNPAQGTTPGQAANNPAHETTPKPVTVVVQPSAVVINGNTIKDSPPVKTQIVVISGSTFTIDPTRVVGAGATVNRPSVTGGIFVPTPTSTTLGGIQVVVSSSVAVIGGTSFTIGPVPTTATVSGQTVVVGPSGIAIASQTLAVPTLPSPTEIVVAGGQLVTAIGQSVLVIQGTTPGPVGCRGSRHHPRRRQRPSGRHAVRHCGRSNHHGDWGIGRGD
ncbi:hypothetical protein B0H66DRAFT_246596 [Apodospora peruviana]|uniref:Uncharacterized protein n=1 Tax=Apodospora peruviana TaxID=516989 RepID=A0AAE0I5Q1_9PEZI|nr:hypothetical protein B0H66DRAFT_246596 [Apodospora peruviana]